MAAQDGRDTYALALDELRAGRKRTHWMWFVFPQLAGLGFTLTSRAFAIADLDEARDYLDHEVLGPRLRECCRALLALEDRTAEQVFGVIDAVKLRSSMTLFVHAAPDEDVFGEVLARFHEGLEDERTVRLLDHRWGWGTVATEGRMNIGLRHDHDTDGARPQPRNRPVGRPRAGSDRPRPGARCAGP